MQWLFFTPESVQIRPTAAADKANRIPSKLEVRNTKVIRKRSISKENVEYSKAETFRIINFAKKQPIAKAEKAVRMPVENINGSSCREKLNFSYAFIAIKEWGLKPAQAEMKLKNKYAVFIAPKVIRKVEGVEPKKNEITKAICAGLKIAKMLLSIPAINPRKA